MEIAQKNAEENHKQKDLSRRIGCHSAALSPDDAITVANAMTSSNFTNHSEIWQMGKEASNIQTELNAIRRTALGVETSTCMSARGSPRAWGKNSTASC